MAFSDTPNLVDDNTKNCIELFPSRTYEKFFIRVFYNLEIIENKNYKLYIAAKPFSHLQHTFCLDFSLSPIIKKNHIYYGSGITMCKDCTCLLDMGLSWKGNEHIGEVEDGWIVFNKPFLDKDSYLFDKPIFIK